MSERDQFEAWFQPRQVAMKKNGIGLISINRLKQRQWEAWQASREALKAEQDAASIDARMEAAGMISARQVIAGAPIDAFLKHSGVVDLNSLCQWAEMRRGEFLRMLAKYELREQEADGMYEWVVSHVGVFGELHVNIRSLLPDNHPIDTTSQQYEALSKGESNAS